MYRLLAIALLTGLFTAVASACPCASKATTSGCSLCCAFPSPGQGHERLPDGRGDKYLPGAAQDFQHVRVAKAELPDFAIFHKPSCTVERSRLKPATPSPCTIPLTLQLHRPRLLPPIWARSRLTTASTQAPESGEIRPFSRT